MGHHHLGQTLPKTVLSVVAGKDNETFNSIAVAFYVYLRKYNMTSEPYCVIAYEVKLFSPPPSFVVMATIKDGYHSIHMPRQHFNTGRTCMHKVIKQIPYLL